MRTEVLNATDLTHTYKGGVTALKGVSLSIYENELVSIVGQNGSGKTTLVRHFNGLLRPTSGSVSLFGEPTQKLTVSQMSRRVGYVFQNPNHQIFCSTVREELSVAPKNFKTPQVEYEAAIEDVVSRMNLKSILDVNPLTLDYTTKKIVTIASVLVFNPRVLILDEPTGGLDEAGRIMLSEITKLVHDAGHTVIMISHDMDFIAAVAGAPARSRAPRRSTRRSRRRRSRCRPPCSGPAPSCSRRSTAPSSRRRGRPRRTPAR